jgi:hypothetical protein
VIIQGCTYICSQAISWSNVTQWQAPAAQQW